ncbi:MAG: hypothetical protein JWQ81_8504 [Amycolatopsis sp.]|uniref:hypothetical protein n=1 Tax=Amycolatopsis sp. TaxID=37632 RepID=UPI0026325555|nr:hypothetical protein [Amycolatopsis sp.]MCU1687765.1 hypothetical protein [Amycolatopsis sp.]
MQRHELDAYLGDFANDLTADQKAELLSASDDIDALYPEDDDLDERQAAFSAAVQYVMGDLDAPSAGDNLLIARNATASAMAAARQIAVMATASGAKEAPLARELGVDRMTVRSWLGK